MERFKNIPITEWNKLLRAVEQMAAHQDKGELITEEKAAEFLGLKPATLRNRRSDGTIPEAVYTRTVTGGILYYKNKLYMS